MIPGAVIAQPLPRPTVRFALGRAGTAPRSSRGRIGGPLRRHGSGTVPFLAVSGPGQGGCDPEALQDALRTWGLGQERPGRANRSKQKNVPSPRPPSPTSRSKEAGGRNSLIPRAFANATEPISPIAVMHGSPWQATGPQRRLIWFLGVSNCMLGRSQAIQRRHPHPVIVTHSAEVSTPILPGTAPVAAAAAQEPLQKAPRRFDRGRDPDRDCGGGQDNE